MAMNEMRINKNNRSKILDKKLNGFSLIELAISLVVIGLIIGGVMKGQELIQGAKINNVVSQISDLRLSVQRFQDLYDALPGDFSKAAERIDSSLKNGNGDHSVSGDGLDENSEAGQFWLHLGKANLLNVSYSGANYTFGNGAPAARLGGGFTVVQNPGDLKGLWFLLGQQNGIKGDGALLTPAQAMEIDKRLDDGKPKSGKIQAKEGAGVEAQKCVRDTGDYNLSVHEPSCILYVQF